MLRYIFMIMGATYSLTPIFAQSKFTKTNCLNKDSAASNVSQTISIDPTEEGSVAIELSKFDGPNPEKKFLLRNLLNESATKPPKIIDGKLTFSLDTPFEGVADVAIFFQLIDTDAEPKCYNYTLKVDRKSPVVAAKITPFKLPASVVNKDCETCAENERIVEYNFSNNKLRTIWPNSTKWLRQRFWYGLPWVGREFTFKVVNVNPFRYDIKIENELIFHNPEIPNLITSSFTPPAATAASLEEKQQQANLKEAMKQFKIVLDAKVLELRDAGDCYNPCDTVKAINIKILKFFEQVGYTLSEPLEVFLTRELDLSREPKDEEKEEFEEFKNTIKTYINFRSIGSGIVYYHIPQTQYADQYSFKLNVTPKEGITTGARVLNQEITVDVLGGFRADASTGLFFTNLMDDKFSLRPDSTLVDGEYVKEKEVIKEGGSKRDFGVASLLHFYPRLTRYVNLGVSLGAGVSLNEKPKLRYLAGGTLLLGSSNRIAVTAGVAFGYVERLSDRYELDDGAYKTSFSETSVQVKKIFENSSFFSVTYNIPIGRKKATVIPSASDSGESSEGDKEDKGSEEEKDKDKDKKDK